MKKVLFFVVSFFIHCFLWAQNYQKLHRQAIVIDTHNDILSKVVEQGVNIDNDLTGKTHSDLLRFKKGGVDVQVFSIFCDETFGNGTAFKRANQEIDSLYAIVRRNSDKMAIVTSPADLANAVAQKKLGAMMGVEGGHMIEDKLSYLDSFYHRGARYLTLTWNNSTDWATSAMDESSDTLTRKKGLTDFGKNVVRHMNELGMLVDVSHVGEQTFWDVIHTTTKPVIASHSCAYALSPVFRNLKDDQIKAIAANGGVIDLNFYAAFVDSNYTNALKKFNAAHQRQTDSLKALQWKGDSITNWMHTTYATELNALRPPLSSLMNQLDYIVKLAGIDHVGLGSDFDGISAPPQQLDDVASFPLITKELLKRGYSKKDIQKILGGNFIRVFAANQSK